MIPCFSYDKGKLLDDCCRKPKLLLSLVDTYIQKARKNFMDSRNRRNLGRINDELQDVQKIMMQNIDDVLQRGEQLSGKVFIFG